MIEQDPNETVMIHTTTGAITNLDRGMVWRLIEMVDDAIMFNEQALKNDPDPDDEKPVYEGDIRYLEELKSKLKGI